MPFDPYHVWLGIPADEQPPNHYRLLGLSLGESDQSVIENAATRQIVHVQSFADAGHPEEAEQIQNEISQALRILLDPQKKEAYDASLRVPKLEEPPPPPLQGTPPSLSSSESLPITPSSKPQVGKRRKKNPLIEFVKIAVGGVAGLVLAILILRYGLNRDPFGIWEQDANRNESRNALNENRDPQADQIERTADGDQGKDHVNPDATNEPTSVPDPPALPPKDTTKEAGSEVDNDHDVPPQESNKGTQTPDPAKDIDHAAPPTAPPPLTPAEDNDTRLSVPEEDAQQKTLAIIKELFEADFLKAKTLDEKSAIAKNLLELADESKDKPTDRYVLLRVARDVATQAGDASTAVIAIDRLAAQYKVDALTMRQESLTTLAEVAMPKERRTGLADVMVSVARDAYQQEQYDTAVAMFELAQATARQVGNIELVKALVQELEAARHAKQASLHIKQALEMLAATPDDPDANLLAGKCYCYELGDWKSGLPMLAKGSDEALRAVAKMELEEPQKQTTDRVKLADGWWNLAQTRHDDEKELLLLHAGTWYKEARAGAEDALLRAKIDKRLDEISEIVQSDKPLTPTMPKELAVELPGGVKMEFVLIPAGDFVMGSSEKERQLAVAQAKAQHRSQKEINAIALEGPQHPVTISKPFYLGKYVVTQTQWTAVMQNNPSERKGANNPVVTVSSMDIQPFLARLNMAFGKEGKTFRLPTEAEWEYACRAGTTTAFSFGDNPRMLAQHAWFKDNSGGGPHPVGQGRPNAWGLYDMHGNVWERCSGWYARYAVAQSPLVDPVGPLTGSGGVVRGGACDCSWERCRSAYRLSWDPRNPHIGFRLALDLAAK